MQVTGSQEASRPLNRAGTIKAGLLQPLRIPPTSASQPLQGVSLANTNGCKLRGGK